ncbi:MAG TPA: hypothetical protein VIK95_07765 [Egibacteraceae bacterium]
MDWLVDLHSWVRWVVVVLGVAAVVVPLLALARQQLLSTVRPALSAYAVALSVQVVIGVVLWLVEGRWDFGNAFFSLVHPVAMIVGTAVAHAGLGRVRRASGTAAARTAAIFAVISLAIVTAAVPTSSWGG